VYGVSDSRGFHRVVLSVASPMAFRLFGFELTPVITAAGEPHLRARGLAELTAIDPAHGSFQLRPRLPLVRTLLKLRLGLVSEVATRKTV
jgi:hypothetical protein